MNSKDETQSASLVSATGDTLGQWRVPENAHQIVQSPKRPTQVFSIPKEGRVVSNFDLIDVAFHKEFVLGEEWRLSGHGCFLPREHLLVVSCFRSGGVVPPEGRLLFIEPDSLREVGRAHSGGHDPHEIAWFEAAGLIVICNGGSHESVPNLSFFDPRQGRITYTWASPLHPTQSLRHLALTSQGDCVVGTLLQMANTVDAAPEVQQPSLLRLRLARNSVSHFDNWPHQDWLATRASLNQFLSLAHDPFTDTFAATSTRGNLVTIHSRMPWELRFALTVSRPTGIAALPGTGSFLVTTESSGAHLVDPVAGSLTKASKWQEQPMNSSHLSILTHCLES